MNRRIASIAILGFVLWTWQLQDEGTQKTAFPTSAIKRPFSNRSTPASTKPESKAVVADGGNSKTPFSKWLSQEAILMDQVQEYPDTIAQRLRDRALKLSITEASELAAIAVDSFEKNNKRKLAMYLLTQHPRRFQKELLHVLSREIDVAKIKKASHAVQEVVSQMEHSISLQALQSLEMSMIKDAATLKKVEDIADQSTNVSLKKYILLSSSAARHGRAYWTTRYNQLLKTASN